MWRRAVRSIGRTERVMLLPVSTFHFGRVGILCWSGACSRCSILWLLWGRRWVEFNERPVQTAASTGPLIVRGTTPGTPPRQWQT